MNSAHHGTIRKPFIEHVHELQKRLTWSLLAVAIGGGIAYYFNEPLLAMIQKPLGQTLYYTTPTGGFSFLFKVCLAAGFVMALPVIIYHVFGFLGPLLHRSRRVAIVAFTMWSFNLAYAGVLFAYFISLPAALHFLANFGSNGVQSLITVDEYFNFALAYLAGFALLFQVPLVILFINKIHRLKPGGMMGAQRFVILFSFIFAAMLTPTPDPFNQLLMAAPAVLLYQVAIILILIINRKKRSPRASRKQAMMVSRPVVAEPMQSVAYKPLAPVSSSTAQVRRTTRKFIDIIPPTQVQAMQQESFDTESALA